MIRRPPRSTHCISSAASDVYKRQVSTQSTWGRVPACKYRTNKGRLTPCQQPRQYGGPERYPDSLGLKGAQAARSVSGERPALHAGAAVDTAGLESQRGGRNARCSGEMHRYRAERLLGSQLAS
eukprot:TRINITY_DN4724_c0_g1_i4.p1 TRINITY_DN4724_c0_g1~~TRINITY_DN4724_c0_g1_i4.p1  ORF type:complete len:124 (+),score=10.05 TRINITY_DN4724_c0_g1_i4:103-474(+)